MTVLWDRLRSSLWPIPLLMLLAALVLLQLTRALDGHLSGGEARQLWWLHSGTGGDARNLLSTLATGVLNIASLVFSITIVALTLAAGQFGSRLVRTYTRELRTQCSLGFFLLTIVYCMLALRMVSEDMPVGEVPQITVTTALVLSIACVLTLVLFLHTVARSIVADNVVLRVSRELDESIEALPDATVRKPAPDAAALLPPQFEQRSRLLLSSREGYVQRIRYEELADFAQRNDLVLRLAVNPGEYVCKDGWMGRVHPAERCPDVVMAALRDAVELGSERTPSQDLEFSVRHLVDVALRALSPGINDANTALVVIDHVRGALSRLLRKELPDGVFRDSQGRCRLLARRHSHAEVIAAALHPIRDSAAPQPLVILGLLGALGKLAEHVRCDEDAEAVAREARLAAEAALLHPLLDTQREAIARAQRHVEDKLALARHERERWPQPAVAATGEGAGAACAAAQQERRGIGTAV